MHAHFGGRLKIKIDAQEALLGDVSGDASWRESREVKLAFGRHAIEIDYEADAKSAKRLGLYWSAAHFELEPISHRSYSHRPSEATEELFERGAQLARGMRCNACHTWDTIRKTLAAPSLTHLEGNLQSDWLIERLSAVERVAGSRMPSFGLSREDSQAIAAALFADSKSSSPPKVYRAPPPKKLKKDEQAPRVEPSAEEGRSAFLTRGCLACHQVGEVGNPSLF